MSAMSVIVRGLKVTTTLAATAIPADLVPPEPRPAGNPVVELEFEGSPVKVAATLNGKSVRKVLKTIAEHGPDGVVVVMQGNLKPGPPGRPWILDSPGISAVPKTPKPAADEPAAVESISIESAPTGPLSPHVRFLRPPAAAPALGRKGA